MVRPVRSTIAIAVTCIGVSADVATLRAQPVDTTRVSRAPLFTARDAVIAGAFAITTVALVPVDRRIDEALRDTNTAWFPRYKRQAKAMRPLQETSLLILALGTYGTGRLAGGKRLADLGLHMVEANLVATVIGHTTKSFAGRIRPRAPDSGPTDFRFLKGFSDVNHRSFPSMHMVGNFAAAAAITAETHRWWPRSTWIVAPLTYGGATYLGVLRLVDGAHWASDIIIGAAIGTFSGIKVVQYAHSHPDNRIDRWLLSVAPTPEGARLSVRAEF